MKLAEALINRADAQKRIQQIQNRLARTIVVQEGENPPEDPATLQQELERAIAEMTRLVKQINRTNAAIVFDDNRTITDALADRDALGMRHKALTDITGRATAIGEQFRYSRAEIKQVATVDVSVLQSQVDDLARQYRELDTAIQQMNWTVDLIEDS